MKSRFFLITILLLIITGIGVVVLRRSSWESETKSISQSSAVSSSARENKQANGSRALDPIEAEFVLSNHSSKRVKKIMDDINLLERKSWPIYNWVDHYVVKLNRTIPRKSVGKTLEQNNLEQKADKDSQKSGRTDELKENRSLSSDEIEHRFSAEKGKNLSFFLAETKGFKGLFEERIKRW